MDDLFLGRQDGPLTRAQLSALRAQACAAEYGHMRPITGDVMLALLDALDAAEAERDAWRDRFNAESHAHADCIEQLGRLLAERAAAIARAEAAEALLREAQEFIDTTRNPPYPAGADLAERIDAVLAAKGE